MEELSVFSTVVGLVAGLLTCLATCGIIMPRLRLKIIDRFHTLISPILNELINNLGKKLDQRDKRFLVMQCTKLASLATFNKSEPPADPDSIKYAGLTLTCRFCDFDIKADKMGCCTDCGLGSRHWLKPSNLKTLDSR